ncbi:hypothetical protein TIFTF001_052880 [Ficus carica]|uniref:Uncharacterized protein n=1 Tax=Ficus carica TaxID=3494 RepID=A0AA88EG92_FICCA|nr:hypothetical protein TIFTF001_052880 [Ficus carica]
MAARHVVLAEQKLIVHVYAIVGLDWPPPTTPWLCTTVSNLPAILDARLWRDGAADC